MIETDEIEKKLKEFGEDIELNPELVKDAEQRIRELYGNQPQPKKRRNRWKIFSIVAAACACLLVAILVPTLYRPHTGLPTVNRYTDEKIEKENVSNIVDFITGNNLSCKYFAGAQQNSAYRIIETSQLVIIEQQYIYLDDAGLDTIQLEVCLTQDEFDRYDEFSILQEQKIVNDINVLYSVTQEGNKNTVKAKFEVDSIWYYWTISTLQGADRIDFYINYLFG